MSFLKKQWNAEIRSAGRRGYTAPFIMVLIGFVYLLLVPCSAGNLEKHTGTLGRYDKGYSKFWLVGDKDAYEVGLKRYREKLEEVSSKSKEVEVWTKKNKRIVMQLVIDGEMVIEYKWWNHSKVFLFFILIGSLLIPIVIREKRKIEKSGRFLN